MRLKPSVTSFTGHESQKHAWLVRAPLAQLTTDTPRAGRDSRVAAPTLNISIFSNPQKTSIHQPKSVSHELLSSRNTDHEYVCTCLEDKILKQMGSAVVYKKPARVFKRVAEVSLRMYTAQTGFRHTRDGGKISVSGGFFASVFPSALAWNNLPNKTLLLFSTNPKVRTLFEVTVIAASSCELPVEKDGVSLFFLPSILYFSTLLSRSQPPTIAVSPNSCPNSLTVSK